MKDKIIKEISDRMKELIAISEYLYENPELGDQEYKAVKLLTEFFSASGFAVECPIYGLATTFRAVYDSGKAGAHIALFCEYDALPQIGHGCGHNLISAMSTGAALGLKAVLDETGGKLSVFGTQAEESSGVKGTLADEGAYEGVTAAMMVHPSAVSMESGTSLALDTIRFRFFGKAAHAAAAPEKGVNALDGVILLYNGLNALRQHVTSDVRIHGIITKGGVAPNIVPDYAEAEFYFRAREKKNLEQVMVKARHIAEGAAQMTGATVKYERFEKPYDDLLTNRALAALFSENLRALGEPEILPSGGEVGSIDMGNVSHTVPAIHPWLGVGDASLVLHSKEFADHTVTEQGRATIKKGACALAATAYDVIVSKTEQDKIREEFVSATK